MSHIEPPQGLEALGQSFEFLDEVGRGGMAVVYRARDRELGREVAIKVLRPGLGSDEEAVARLELEARVAAYLEHPNILSLYGLHRSGGQLALVMPYVRGPNLAEALNRSGPLEGKRTIRVLKDVAAGLGYAHRRGIVHRDVKPENVFLDADTGRALLADFGIAKGAEAASRLTQTGTAIGTPNYMSPEQIDGSQIDGRADIYSLGLVGWELLTGKQPWEGESLYAVIYKQKHAELPPLEEFRSDVPKRLKLAIAGALRKDPAERWESAEALIEALDGRRRSLPPRVAPSVGAKADGAIGDVVAPGIGSSAGLRESRAGETVRYRPGEHSGGWLARLLSARQTPVTPTPQPAGDGRSGSRERLILALGGTALSLGLALILAHFLLSAAANRGSSSVDPERPAGTRPAPPIGERTLARGAGDSFGAGGGGGGPAEPGDPQDAGTGASQAGSAVPEDAGTDEGGSGSDAGPVVIADDGSGSTQSNGDPDESSGAGDVAVAVPESVTVRFEANIPAQIYLRRLPDGELEPAGRVGRRQRLRAGTYEVTYRHPAYREWRSRREFTTPGDTYTVAKGDYVTTGSLLLSVAGGWASVSVDGGEEQGAPMLYRNLSVGSHVVRISRPGFQTKTDTVFVMPAPDTTKRVYSLTPEGGAPDGAAQAGTEFGESGSNGVPVDIGRPSVPAVQDIAIPFSMIEEEPVGELPPPPTEASRVGDQPVFTPHTVRPEVRDRRDAVRVVERFYPESMKKAGIGGTVHVYVFVDTMGIVRNAQINRSAGHPALDEAALAAVRHFAFTPALNRDKRVPIWISIPITFSVRDPGL